MCAGVGGSYFKLWLGCGGNGKFYEHFLGLVAVITITAGLHSRVCPLDLLIYHIGTTLLTAQHT